MKTNHRQQIQIPEELLLALKDAYKKKQEVHSNSIRFSRKPRPTNDFHKIFANRANDNSNEDYSDIKFSLADVDYDKASDEVEEESSEQTLETEPVEEVEEQASIPQQENEITKEELLSNVSDNLHTIIERSIKYSIKEVKLSSTFKETLFKLIDDRNLKDSVVYKKAKVDRRLFSKIRSDKSVARNTVLRLALALELNLEEATELLKAAHYALADNDYYDVVIKWCIENKVYDVDTVDNLLFSLRLDSIFSKY